ncbi:hypothetical protein Val02_07990 [Virgisporangium aliadipatigenens]|uniref:Winged helix DNA-binding domain-containing protein n=1 Tax=Virgisporangium aliadipatigenens TaxID=741659 RepID=A0A8J3YH72_9ACTN|nr:winged helix DNA-binding domain-containing protein [Virgisporangium aliadipatigenens]GIJ43913.1 hypothetical protein Val02_07990 [Virgisporangium aliadipatigenens]
MEVSFVDVCRARSARHLLTAPGPDAVTAVRAMCGAHAQVISAAELSVALRWDGATRTSVRDALWRDRVLVKTFGPRGTVHLLPTTDLPRWVGALSAIPWQPVPLPAAARLDAARTDDVVAAIGAALAGAELTVDELDSAVVDALGPWAGELCMPAFQGWWPRWRQAIGTAAHRGALCFGPPRGRTVTYTGPSRWSPGFAPDGPTDLVRDYLQAYGPAAPRHFAQWLAAPVRWATERFAAHDDLEPVTVAGETLWRLPGDTFDAPPSGLRLLPYFDPYVVGSHPRAALFAGAAAERALSRTGQAGNFPVLVVDGLVAGVWHQRRSGRRIAVTVEPLAPLTVALRRALAHEVERVGAALEAVPTLTVGPVTVGPHA